MKQIAVQDVSEVDENVSGAIITDHKPKALLGIPQLDRSRSLGTWHTHKRSTCQWRTQGRSRVQVHSPRRMGWADEAERPKRAVGGDGGFGEGPSPRAPGGPDVTRTAVP